MYLLSYSLAHSLTLTHGHSLTFSLTLNQLESRLPVGTPEYIAPEVLTSLDKSADYGVGCDWWSLGIIAYELLCEMTPFEDESTSKTYANIMNYKVSQDPCHCFSFNLVNVNVSCIPTHIPAPLPLLDMVLSHSSPSLPSDEIEIEMRFRILEQ